MIQTKLSFLAYFLMMVCLVSCETPPANETSTDVMNIDAFSEPEPIVGLFVLGLEKAHNAVEYRKRENVKFEVLANYGELQNVHATITMSTRVKDVKIDNDDGTFLIYQESTTSLNEDSIMQSFEHFKHFAWAHFFSLPKRLRNKNVKVEKIEGSSQLGNETFKVRKILLEPRAGYDDIFEWYIVYADESTGLLRYAGYGMPDQLKPSDATKAHIVEYSDYRLIEGIPIAHRWDFYQWNQDKAIGKRMGEVNLSSVEFVEVDKDFYE